jgi:hypothetical protein
MCNNKMETYPIGMRNPKDWGEYGNGLLQTTFVFW